MAKYTSCFLFIMVLAILKSEVFVLKTAVVKKYKIDSSSGTSISNVGDGAVINCNSYKVQLDQANSAAFLRRYW